MLCMYMRNTYVVEGGAFMDYLSILVLNEYNGAFTALIGCFFILFYFIFGKPPG